MRRGSYEKMKIIRKVKNKEKGKGFISCTSAKKKRTTTGEKRGQQALEIEQKDDADDTEI